jgi:hypothetical protein
MILSCSRSEKYFLLAVSVNWPLGRCGLCHVFTDVRGVAAESVLRDVDERVESSKYEKAGLSPTWPFLSLSRALQFCRRHSTCWRYAQLNTDLKWNCSNTNGWASLLLNALAKLPDVFRIVTAVALDVIAMSICKNKLISASLNELICHFV